MLHEFKAITCAHCGFTVRVPVYCGNRFCSVCSPPRLARIRKRLELLVSTIPFVKGCDLKHLTLTITNRGNLESMVRVLVSSFRKLRHRRLWKSNVYGGAFVIEVTGAPGDWHAHVHTIIQSPYLPWTSLLEEWIRCSGGRGVYIQRIPKREIVRYLTKYLSKNGTGDPSDRQTGRVLANYRLFQSFGKWHGIPTKLPKPQFACPQCNSVSWIPLDVLLLPDRRYIKFNNKGVGYG